jgi:hypothetical protein
MSWSLVATRLKLFFLFLIVYPIHHPITKSRQEADNWLLSEFD